MNLNHLKKGDCIAIVSLSSGILGEQFCKYQLEIGIRRLENMGLKVKFMNNSLQGDEFIKNNPEKRAEDLKQAFLDKEVKIIMSAIGGDDSFKLIPFLYNDQFKEIVMKNPKIFIGYSDTTNMHLMLNKIGLKTYYGHAFLTDIAEFDVNMLDYSYNSFLELFNITQEYEIKSADIWFEERKNWNKEQINTPRTAHKEKDGHIFINCENKIIEGELYGGCLESIYSILTGDRYKEQKEVFEKYQILPDEIEWKSKVLFIETSEEKPNKAKLIELLKALEEKNIFKNIKALLVGKPQDNTYFDDYIFVFKQLAKKYNLPIVFNLNFGHSYPKFIISYKSCILIDSVKNKLTIKNFI
ncbi:hypothetical protein SHELI_v1c05460 [Spiroplasma helicoides]|uniref:LD-carboxypeptidase n=1 Tax=Spiroplasma helicoides TaxID=216938 RepID=A0A1B3SKQ2_9MOLU|nr:S66 peptidase family protein [Spiroplasma helicoides]AOG60497.1 hypothetical protein SHELI_v1c05460 [Spiroplasma helicoides]